MSQQQTKVFVTTLVVLSFLIVAVMVISMNIGPINLTPSEVIKTFFGYGTEDQTMILFEFRLPRIVIAVLVGMGLAVASAILQGVTKNPLADSGILGINAGAGFTVVIYIVYIGTSSVNNPMFLPMLAFLGGSFAAFLIYVISYKKGKGTSGSRIILTGIGVNIGLSALMAAITIKMDPHMYDFVIKWLSGTLWGTNWTFVLALLPWIVILIPLAIYKSSTLDLLSLDEDISTGLGLSVEKERLKMIIISVALSSASVALCGGISFVGLIAPNIARKFIGDRYARIIPVSALIGGLLVLSSDALAQFIFSPVEIPTGIAVSFVGAPYFLYLLAKTKD